MRDKGACDQDASRHPDNTEAEEDPAVAGAAPATATAPAAEETQPETEPPPTVNINFNLSVNVVETHIENNTFSVSDSAASSSSPAVEAESRTDPSGQHRESKQQLGDVPESLLSRAAIAGKWARQKLNKEIKFVKPSPKIRSGDFSFNSVYVLIQAAERHQPAKGFFYGKWEDFVEYVAVHKGKNFPFDNRAIFHGFATGAEALTYWTEVFGNEDPDILPQL